MWSRSSRPGAECGDAMYLVVDARGEIVGHSEVASEDHRGSGG